VFFTHVGKLWRRPEKEDVLMADKSRKPTLSLHGIHWQRVARPVASWQVAMWLHSLLATHRAAKVYVQQASWQRDFEVANSLPHC
jgi:hypothetical protein